MRRRIEELADRFEEFVSEDDHDCLVITCADDGVGLVGAAVDLMEQRGSIDVNIAFFEPFVDVAGVVARVAAQMTASVGHEVTIASPTAAATVDAGGELWSELGGHGDVRVVLWICPAAIGDVAAYVELVRALARSTHAHRPQLRLAVRGSGDTSFADGLREDGRRLLEASIASDAKAIRDGLAEDASAPNAPRGVRAAAALAVAMADAADGRTTDALRALSSLADMHHADGDQVSRGLCFSLAAGLLARNGQSDEARAHAKRGLALAFDHASPALAISAAITVGELAWIERDVVEADAHFDLAARLAAAAGHYGAIAHALLRRAPVLVETGRLADARDALACAAIAASRAGSVEVERDALEQLAALFLEARMLREADAIQLRANALPRAHAHHARTP